MREQACMMSIEDSEDDATETTALAVSVLAQEIHQNGATCGCATIDLVEPDGTPHVATVFTFIDRPDIVRTVVDLLEAITRTGARPSEKVRSRAGPSGGH